MWALYRGDCQGDFHIFTSSDANMYFALLLHESFSINSSVIIG